MNTISTDPVTPDAFMTEFLGTMAEAPDLSFTRSEHSDNRSVTTRYTLIGHPREGTGDKGTMYPCLEVTTHHSSMHKAYVTTVSRIVKHAWGITTVISLRDEDPCPVPSRFFEPTARYNAKRLSEIHQAHVENLEESELDKALEWATRAKD